MFPTATSTIYRNEDGEVLGWETIYDEPDYGYSEDEIFRGMPEPEFDFTDCDNDGYHGDESVTVRGKEYCVSCGEPV